MRSPGSHEKVLRAFKAGQVDILLGTQMIAKGLDFPNVTLVGVIDADVGINLPDFRASERCFQLLSQVAGRAGRGPLGGTGTRSFASDTRGTIFYTTTAAAPANPIPAGALVVQ